MFTQSIKALALLIGLYLEKNAEQYFLNTKVPVPLLLLLAGLVLIAFISFSEWFAEFAIDHWRGLRRLILRDAFVEGIWFNMVPGRPAPYGLLKISMSAGTVKIDGEQYDAAASLTATWHSEMARFDGRILKYVYRVRYSRDSFDADAEGITTLSFANATSSGVPRTYNGHYQDITTAPKILSFTAWRVEAPELLTRLETDDRKQAAVLALIGQATAS